MPLNPTAYGYDLAVMSPEGDMLHIPRGSLVLEEQGDEMSATLRCVVPDVETTKGPMRKLVPPGAPIYCYVVQRGPTGGGLTEAASSSLAGGTPWDPGTNQLGFTGGESGRKEIFRGTIMEQSRSTNSIEIEVIAHDVLFTTLKHEVDATIKAGETFQEALARLSKDWGLTVGRVDGPEATMPDMTWRGEPVGTILQEMLDMAQGEGGGKYIVRATGAQVEVVEPGKNEPIYLLSTAGGGAGVTSAHVSIAELVNGVTVVSDVPPEEDKKTEDKEKPKPPAQEKDGSKGKAVPLKVVKKLETDARYNGANKQVYVQKNSSEEAAELEAQIELARKGFPEWTFEHETVDIPMVRRYDRIAIADDLLQALEPLYVLSVSHEASQGTMKLTLQSKEDWERMGEAAVMEAQLAKLKGEEKAAAEAEKAKGGGSSGGNSADARGRILDKCRHTFGTPYVWGGPGGRSDFSPDHCNSDCSGFVTWLCHQLGAPTGVYAFTDNMAGVSQLVSDGGVAGDFVLQKDPSVQAGATYYHVQMLLGPGEVVEDGGTQSPSGIGIGHPFGNYEIRRFQPLYQLLHGGSGKKKSTSKDKE